MEHISEPLKPEIQKIVDKLRRTWQRQTTAINETLAHIELLTKK